jgi:type I restriction enzyme S subunit
MFLFYFFIRPAVRKAIARKMQGITGRQRVPKDVVKTTPIPLPEITEQREIARILDTVDRKIEAEEKRKVTLKGLFKTMLHKLRTAR